MKAFIKTINRYRGIMAGATIVFAMLMISIFGQHFSPYNPLKIDIKNSLQAPSKEHPLGTDDVGRDIFVRLVVGSRVSLRVGAGVALISTVFGTLLGLVSGYFQKLDSLIMRIMDAVMSFPSLILALAAVAIMGPAEINTILALGIVYIPSTARIVRASTLTIKEWSFVEASKAQGAGSWCIMFKHILPNCLAPLLVQATYVFAVAIIGESSLSFLGAGPPPPAPTLGNMISDARIFLRPAPWFSLFPGAVIFVTTVGLNLLGDGLRDILDPRLNQVF